MRNKFGVLLLTHCTLTYNPKAGLAWKNAASLWTLPATATWNLLPTRTVSSVAQLCPTLCDPMDCSTPGFPVHHQLPQFTQTPVYRVCDAIQPSHPLSSLPAFNLSKSSGYFQMSQLFATGGQSIGVSALPSVLPMNTQDWSPSGWTGWISLKSKGLSRVFSNTTVKKHQFFSAQLSL